VFNETLRIAVVEGKPTRLHLHHDSVARKENVIGGRKAEAIQLLLTRRYWLRHIEPLAIAAPQDIARDHQLVTAHLWVAPDFIRIHVDELDDEVAVRAARRGNEIGNRLAADLQRL